jgi:hypothetical protein
MAGTGALPQNQIDALPLITPAQAVQASIVIRSGGQFYRSFSPTDLGINGITPTLFVFSGAQQESMLVTPYLDLSFCNRFRIALRRSISNGTAAIAGDNVIFSIQMRMGPADAPAPGYSTGTQINDTFASRAQIGSVNLGFPAIEAGTTQTLQIGWTDSQTQGDGQQGGTAIALGGNCRIIASFGPVAINALHIFSMQLDAQT